MVNTTICTNMSYTGSILQSFLNHLFLCIKVIQVLHKYFEWFMQKLRRTENIRFFLGLKPPLKFEDWHENVLSFDDRTFFLATKLPSPFWVNHSSGTLRPNKKARRQTNKALWRESLCMLPGYPEPITVSNCCRTSSGKPQTLLNCLVVNPPDGANSNVGG